MVDAVVSFCVQKLGEQITQEIQLLSGVREDVAWIKDELQFMKSFLIDADRRRQWEDGLETWVTQVRHLVFRAEDAVDGFMIQADMRRRLKNRFMGHLLFHACFLKSTIARHQFGAEMQIIRSQVKEIDERRRRYEIQPLPQEGTSSHVAQIDPGVAEPWVEEEDLVGFEKDYMKLQQWLVEANETRGRAIISIVGAGGMGKTTLAKKAYKDIQTNFQCYAWVSVSQTFQTKDVLKKMLKSFFESAKETPPKDMETMEEAELRKTIFDYLRGKRYALVLDDIWDARVWESVKQALPREGSSKIVLTTRIQSIAPVDERLHIHELQPLSDDLAWELFCRKAFRNESPCGACPKHLVEVSKAMINKCKGLPLAIVAIGGLMSKKGTNPSEWNEVLGNLGWELNHNEDLARLNSVLLTSYNYLPSRLKHCFLYCAMFPEDAIIQRNKLILIWVAEGFVEECPPKTLEESANDCFVQLIERNMLLPVDSLYGWRLESCQMHDIMRDIAIYMFKKEYFATIVGNHSKDVEENQHRRRLSIQSKVVDIRRCSAPSNPRALLTFGEDEFSSSVLRRMLSDFKFLRVLDLEDSKIVDLPKEIGGLIHLRYLNLRWTGIEILPKALQRLHNLQTLVARGSDLKSIPDYIIKLVQLRHLLIGSYGTPLKMPRGISNLSSLQTLSGVLIDDNLLRELGNLRQMKELGIEGVKEEHCRQLCDSISHLQQLRSLCIKADGNELLQLQSLQQPPQYLEELSLGGIMEELPHWIGSLSCVRQILLRKTKLVDDPLPTLGLLPNLLVLILDDNAYVGKQIGFSPGGFPKLRSLDISRMEVLEELSRVEEGTLQSLQLLDISSCEKLKILPDGLQHVVSTKELRLWSMPEEFINRIKRGGEDHFKVQHIPLITHDHIVDGKYVTDRLS